MASECLLMSAECKKINMGITCKYSGIRILLTGTRR